MDTMQYNESQSYGQPYAVRSALVSRLSVSTLSADMGGGDFSPVEFTRIRAILHSPPLHKTLFTDERPPARGTCIPSVHPDYLK